MYARGSPAGAPDGPRCDPVIEQIFLGYDHIAFLIAIILWAQRLWPVIKIVTASRVAHSVTLSLAALQIVAVPSSMVEPVMAASIVFVARM